MGSYMGSWQKWWVARKSGYPETGGIMGKLTDKKLQALVKAGGPLSVTDGDGLTFTLSASGTAAWVLRYRINGKRKELSLGRYPTLSLADARTEATKARGKVATGVDVAAEKQATREKAAADALTFRKVADEYLQVCAVKLARATVYGRTQQLRDYAFPTLGQLPIREIKPEQISEVIRATVLKSPDVGRLALIAVRAVFAHAVATGQMQHNPCAHIEIGAFINTEVSRRERIKLTEAELRALFKALPTMGKSNDLTIRLLLATATRIGELTTAKWEHVDLDARLWTVPADTAKNSREFKIPLTEQVAGWFTDLKALSFGSAYVLPIKLKRGPNPADKPMESSSLNAAINRLCASLGGSIRRFTPHDLRSTARSLLTDELGVELYIAERCLNHHLGGLMAVYDKSDYLPQRREAMERLSRYLDTVERGESWNVAPLRKSA